MTSASQRWLAPLAGALVGILVTSGCDYPVIGNADPNRFMMTLRGDTMGTTYRVSVISRSPFAEPDREELSARLEEILFEVNRQMSTYLPDSEISKFNRFQDEASFPISKEFSEVLSLSLALAEESEGAFDPTILPLIEKWGFDAQDSSLSTEEIRELVDHRLIQLDHLGVRKADPRVRIGLSAVAKGFGVDAIAESLATSGYVGAMVEIGGEVRTLGRNREDRPWRIGIEKPIYASFQRVLELVVGLEDWSAATSGDYRNYREENGVRISHTFDPRTLAPLEHRLASVTVVARTCALADGLATAANVLGPEAGLRLLEEREDVEGLLIVRRSSQDGFETLETSGFRQFTVD